MVLLRYIISGAANSLVGLAIIYISKALGCADILANVIGYASGFILSFFINRNWTFDDKSRGYTALIRFAAVMLVAYLCNLAVVVFTIWSMNLNSYVAQAIGIPIYTLVGFLGCRFFAFPNKTRYS